MSAAFPTRAQGFDATLARRLGELLGPQGFTENPERMAPHLTDWRQTFHGRAAALLMPASTEEVAAAVRLCAEARIGIVPQGGNTGLCGGATPSADGDQVVLSLARMNRIRAVDPANFTMTVEAGCVLQRVQEAASAVDRLFPLSLGAEGTCQIGGNISTNAGGVAVLRYGNMRELVLGLEVVLPSGEVWNGLKALRKDNTGYDLKQLFIGAEGTLGIVTAAVLELFPKPAERVTAFAALPDVASATALLARARAATGDALTSFELIPRNLIEMARAHVPGTIDPLPGPHPQHVLIEACAGASGRGLREAVEALLARGLEDGLVRDATIAESEAAARRLWHLREAIVAAQRLEGASIKHDIAVPVSRVAEFIARAETEVTRRLPGVRPVPFGHLGDGNVHFNLCQPKDMAAADFLARGPELTRAVHDLAVAMGGSFSAEHGLGQLRRGEADRYKSETERATLRAIKAALDPLGIMNPGKVI
ncbi:MAG: FAD-binding oxidoreductase [Pseudomonadota bacterium]